jgi:CheY-like chemotaxis protein
MSGLQHTTILIVEDQLQIRSLLASVLRTFGVGNILRASNGAEAIELLRTVARDPSAAGASRVDAILSDWVMHPVDGAMLLRWVRKHKESPNRFMPFVMITAYSDPARVQFARDLGVTEFLSKPFSAQSVAVHLMAALKDRRRFVKKGSFFGPDRRRREALSPEERRDAEASDEAKGVTFYDPPQDLRRRLSKAEIDVESILNVQREMDGWAEDFRDWTDDFIRQIESALGECRKSPTADRRKPFNRINFLAHEMRGQGGTFGYPLVSQVARSLFDLTLHNLDRSDACCDLIGEHVRVLKAVIREDIKGDGGLVGRELLDEMRRANAKFLRSAAAGPQYVSRAFQESNAEAMDDDAPPAPEKPKAQKQLLNTTEDEAAQEADYEDLPVGEDAKTQDEEAGR